MTQCFTSLSGMVLLATIATAQCNDAIANANAQDATIVEVAAGNKDFSTLVTALKAAELDSILSGKWPLYGLCTNQRGLQQAAKGDYCKAPSS